MIGEESERLSCQRVHVYRFCAFHISTPLVNFRIGTIRLAAHQAFPIDITLSRQFRSSSEMHDIADVNFPLIANCIVTYLFY